MTGNTAYHMKKLSSRSKPIRFAWKSQPFSTRPKYKGRKDSTDLVSWRARLYRLIRVDFLHDVTELLGPLLQVSRLVPGVVHRGSTVRARPLDPCADKGGSFLTSGLTVQCCAQLANCAVCPALKCFRVILQAMMQGEERVHLSERLEATTLCWCDEISWTNSARCCSMCPHNRLHATWRAMPHCAARPLWYVFSNSPPHFDNKIEWSKHPPPLD